MKRISTALLSTLALVAAIAVSAAAAVGGSTTIVNINKQSFNPVKVTVKAGATVEWKNTSSSKHEIVADDGGFKSAVLASGDSFSYTFSENGVFSYHDLFSKAKGEVVVSRPLITLTVQAKPSKLVYGASALINGIASPSTAGQPVTLYATPAGKTKPRQVAATVTGVGGAFSFTVTPKLRTSYEVRYLTARSRPLTVRVSPRVTLSVQNGLYTTTVASTVNYAGHYVLVQRKNKSGYWYTVRTLKLGTLADGSYGKQFSLKLPAGSSTLRVLISAGQAGFGYSAGSSPMLTLTS